MIGHYLMTLTQEQEDRVLLMRMGRGFYLQRDGCRCLRGAAENFAVYEFLDRVSGHVFWPPYDALGRNVGLRYDLLCLRFGDERINCAVRNRILSNRARRTLSGSAVVDSEALQNVSR